MSPVPPSDSQNEYVDIAVPKEGYEPFDAQNEYEEFAAPTEDYEHLHRPKDENLQKDPIAIQPESHSGCRKSPLFWRVLALVLFIIVVVLLVTLVTGKSITC